MKYNIFSINYFNKFSLFVLGYLFFTTTNYAQNMTATKKNGKFQNPIGSPVRGDNVKFSYTTFLKEKKKLKINIPNDHIIDEKVAIKSLEQNNDDYIMWIGHATFLIKLGENIIITDPIFSKNAGPLMFGSHRFVKPAIPLKKIPETNLLLLTHNHYDHLDTRTLKKYPFKKTKVITPLKLKKYFSFRGFKDINELDWYETIHVNESLKITLLPAVHWSKRTLFDTNKTLWGSFLIQYKNQKILFACDTGSGNVYREIGDKFGPIDILFINIGAYDFKPMFNKSIYHTTPEEAVEIGRDIKAKKIIGMHWGTFILSLEDPFEPPVRFKNAAEKYNYNKEDLILFKIGELKKIQHILK